MVSFLCLLLLSTASATRIRSSAEDIETELIRGNSKFGHQLTKALYENSATNIWISPFSITSLFALLYPGSGGNTASQIGNTMRYPYNAHPDDVAESFMDLEYSIESLYDGSGGPKHSIIGIANKIFSSKDLTLKQSFIDAINDEEETRIEADFDFAASDAGTKINQWVFENTNGLIDEIATGYSSNWQMAALNAIYVNATFQHAFLPEYTSENKFFNSLWRRNEVADCHLMHNLGHFEYFQDGNYQFLKLPFSDDEDLFALFALPMNPEVYAENNGLILDLTVIDNAIDHLNATYVALALPKLSIQTRYTLNGALWSMGLIDAFTVSADFKGITDDTLHLDSVVHKTVLEMDESGLLAAAVTAVIFETAFEFKTNPILFKADHSFQMFIIDGAHENTVLFMGQINNPGIPEGSHSPIYNESLTWFWDDTRNFSVGDAKFLTDIDIPVDGTELAPVFAASGQTRDTLPMETLLMTLFTALFMFF